jgi:serine/threonine protein kinase
MSSELTAIAENLQSADSYLGVFGACDGDGKAQEDHVKRIYRRLVRTVHPDRYTDEVEKRLAKEAFLRLSDFQQSALRAVKDGSYGQLPKLVVTTRHYRHELGAVMHKGDLADIYAAQSFNGSAAAASAVKLARSAADSDLMEAETRALRKLLASDGDENLYPFFPQLLDSFAYRGNRTTRRGNVLEKLDGWYSLKEVHSAYPAGLHPLDMVWIWRKALWAAGYAHQRGLVHGALVPDHIMVHPEHHGLKLTDWCYSTVLPDDDRPTPIKAIIPAYRQWYPAEVLAREAPSAGTDIYLLVRSIAYLLGGDGETGYIPARVPRGIRAFFKGCTQADQRLRPQNAWELLAEFDELLERLGQPYWPRRFRKLQMPG